MVFIKHIRRKFLIFLAVCFAVMFLSYISTVSTLPGKLTLFEGEEYVYDFKSPFLISITADREGVVKLNSESQKTNNQYFRLSNPISLKSIKRGCVNLKMQLFGVIPLKTMEISVVSNQKIVACGNTIGVKLKLNGILVIGVSDVEDINGDRVFPTKQANIKPGDLIIKVNAVKLTKIDDLVNEIEKSNGNNITLEYKHGEDVRLADIKPVMSIDDKKYHIGLWVRDSTAGIGTLTFYDPSTKSFGALGHGITDLDTGALMPVKSGEILESNILAIKKGRSGSPGELKGVFVEDRNRLGTIDKNSNFGIYGVINADLESRISGKLYPIALRDQVKEGTATILANIEGNKVDEYQIEIQKVSKQRINSAKGMVIKITDERLLDQTGGIVQGMSGSPIIQDGRIVGAVTHVLVNDPTRGYGIFIEKMMQSAIENEIENMKKAS